MPLTDRLKASIRSYLGITNQTTGVSESGIDIDEGKALALSAWFGAVDRIVKDIASTNISLYRKTDAGREEMRDDPRHFMLRHRPNPHMTAQQLFGPTVYWMATENAAFIYKERVGNRVVALWPIRGDRMARFVGADEYGRGFRSYVYTDGTKETHFSDDEIIPITSPLSRDGYSGISALAAAKNAVGEGLAKQSMAAEFYKNGTHVSGIIELPAGANLDENSLMRLKRSWADDAGAGKGRGGKVKVLEDGASFQQVSFNARDAQLIESRELTWQEICMFIGISPTELGLLDNAIKANIEQQSINHVTRCLRPHFVAIEQALNAYLLTDDEIRAGYYFEFNTESLIRGDFLTMMQGLSISIEKGIFSVNDARAKLNMNAVDFGDIHTQQGAQATLEVIARGANYGDPGQPADTQAE